MKTIVGLILMSLLILKSQSAVYGVSRKLTFTINGGFYRAVRGGTLINEQVSLIPFATDVIGVTDSTLTVSFLGYAYDNTEPTYGESCIGKVDKNPSFHFDNNDLMNDFTVSANGTYEYIIPRTDTRMRTRAFYKRYVNQVGILYTPPNDDYHIFLDVTVDTVHIKEFGFKLSDDVFYDYEDIRLPIYDDSGDDGDDSQDDMDPSTSQSGTSGDTLASDNSLNPIDTSDEDDDGTGTDTKLMNRKLISKKVLNKMGEFFDQMIKNNNL